MIREVSTGTIIPRDDGKLIDEHAGAVHTKADAYSVARMLAPPVSHKDASHLMLNAKYRSLAVTSL